ncbi:MAG TPA: hypothetical protein GX507_05090 [Clostridia bacterium]|nr:hypothetical protein [Clostridia bacterium]
MKVKVKAYGGLAHYLPDRKEEIEVEIGDGMALGDLVKGLGIPEEEIWLVSVDNALKPKETILKGGEEVLIFAPVAGGLSIHCNRTKST